MDSEWKYPAIVSEKALKEAREKVNPTSVDGKSEFSLAWRMCLEWVQKNYDLNPKGNEMFKVVGETRKPRDFMKKKQRLC